MRIQWPLIELMQAGTQLLNVWKTPMPGWMKINCDTAFKESGNAVFGVIRNDKGMLMDGAARESAADDKPVAEAIAVKEG
ncbi:hypothetical protein V6N13_007993 [Hibiscus sabdariffa]|uniref:RNase H type-1 domain-containing protein n=1 Tax=Hibiscus sabdariffa TaxID=183260 RepID=A0ABR2EDR8_9ROSI